MSIIWPFKRPMTAAQISGLTVNCLCAVTVLSSAATFYMMMCDKPTLPPAVLASLADNTVDTGPHLSMSASHCTWSSATKTETCQTFPVEISSNSRAYTITAP